MSNATKGFIIVLLALALLPCLERFDLHRVSLIGLSTVVLAVCIFSFTRARETAQILRDGILKSFADIEDDVQIDLGRFGRHTRYFMGFVSVLTIGYWFGIRMYVNLALGLMGASIVFAELILNLEVVDYLCSTPTASFTATTATRIVTVYRALSLVHMGTVVTAITLLLTA